MSDRNFKLRQMYADYLDARRDATAVKKPDPLPMVASFNALTDEEKKKVTALKIEEEGKEVFEPITNMRPILIVEKDFELKKAHKIIQPPKPVVNPDADPPSFYVILAKVDETVSDAKRLLQLFNKTKVLESKSFRGDDIQTICHYFTDSREQPNDRLISVLDYIFTQSILYILSLGASSYDVVDHKLRIMMDDQTKTKLIIMDTLLKNPDLMPDSWGRLKAQLRKTEAREADILKRIDDEKMMEAERERERIEAMKVPETAIAKEGEKEKEKAEGTDKDKDKENDKNGENKDGMKKGAKSKSKRRADDDKEGGDKKGAKSGKSGPRQKTEDGDESSKSGKRHLDNVSKKKAKQSKQRRKKNLSKETANEPSREVTNEVEKEKKPGSVAGSRTTAKDKEKKEIKVVVPLKNNIPVVINNNTIIAKDKSKEKDKPKPAVKEEKSIEKAKKKAEKKGNSIPGRPK